MGTQWMKRLGIVLVIGGVGLFVWNYAYAIPRGRPMELSVAAMLIVGGLFAYLESVKKQPPN